MALSSGPTKEADFENKDAAKKCPICKHTFGLTLWRHNCRWCGEVVCDDCSKTTIALPPTYPEPVRVCDLCKVPASSYGARGGPRKLGTAATATTSDGNNGSNSAAAPSLSSGGQGSSANYDEERAKRAAAVAARMKANNATSSSTRGAGASGNNDSEEADRQRQRELRQRIYEKDMAQQQKERQQREQQQVEKAVSEQMSTPTPTAATSEVDLVPIASETEAQPTAPAPSTAGANRPAAGTNPMLEAALRRQEAAKAKNGAAARSAPTTVDPERTQLLSRITTLLAKQRKDEPFGLRSMDAAKLRVYLRHLEGE